MRDAARNFDDLTERTLIELIYECTLGEERWRRALPALCARLDCQGMGSSVGYDGDSWPGHRIFDARRDSEVLAPTRWQNLILDDPIPYQEMVPGKVYRMSDLLDPSKLITTSYYRELLEPAGYGSFVGMTLALPRGLRIWLFFYRSRDAPDFDEQDFETFQGLLPHFQLAARLLDQIQESETARRTYSAAIDGLDVGAILLDREGTVQWTNRVAQDLMGSDAIPLRVRDGRLQMGGVASAEFDEILRRMLVRPECARPEVLAIPRTGTAPFGMVMRPCVSSGSALWSRATVVLYLSDPERSTATPESLIGELFGLSPAEARLASHIAAGLTLTDAAERQGLSEASARTYSKRIYSKIGVSRQADLVRLVLRSVATFAAERG